MTKSTSPRRQAMSLMVGFAVGTLPMRQASAQSVSFALKEFPPSRAGIIHGRRISETKEVLKGNTPTSRDGLQLLVDVLVALKVLITSDADHLKKLIALLFEVPELARALAGVADLLKNLGPQANELLVALIDIVRDSVGTVRNLLDGVNWTAGLQVVASDLAGALSGAATGAQLGGKAGAIVGAVIGGSSASINSALALRK